MNRRHERGQALVETAFTIFFFVAVLGLVMNASRFGVLTERAQIGVRVAGLIGGQQDPYHSYSLNSVYQALDNSVGYQSYATGAANEFSRCTKPQNTSLTQGAPFNLTSDAAQFWMPTSQSTPLCTGEEAIFDNATVGTTNGIIVQQSDYTIAATSQNWNSFADAPVAQALKVNATAHFFAPSSVTTLLQCYTTLGTTVDASLHPTIPQTSDPGPPPPMSTSTVNAIRTTVIVAPKPCQALAIVNGPYAAPPTPPVTPTQPSNPGNPGGPTSSPTPTHPGTPPGGKPTPPPAPTHAPVTPPPHPSTPAPKPSPVEPHPTPAPTAPGKPTAAPAPPVPTKAPATPAPTKPPAPTPAPATPAPTPAPTQASTPKPTQAPTQAPSSQPSSAPIPTETPSGSTNGGSGGGTFAF